MNDYLLLNTHFVILFFRNTRQAVKFSGYIQQISGTDPAGSFLLI